MTEKMRRDFCIECRKETEYLLQKRDMVKTIKDKSYKFEITVAVCMECGREMSIPGSRSNIGRWKALFGWKTLKSS